MSEKVFEIQLNKYLVSEKKKLPETQIVQFAHHICSGLAWLHEQKIVHKDIRCRNVLIFTKRADWVARLCLAGAGSLVPYVKNGYGYKNVKDKDTLEANQDSYTAGWQLN